MFEFMFPDRLQVPDNPVAREAEVGLYSGSNSLFYLLFFELNLFNFICRIMFFNGFGFCSSWMTGTEANSVKFSSVKVKTVCWFIVTNTRDIIFYFIKRDRVTTGFNIDKLGRVIQVFSRGEV